MKHLHQLLKVDYKRTDNIWLEDQLTLRKWIGILGMALPPLLYIFLRLDTHYITPLESISHYYYTRVCGIFIIIVSMLAIFLIVYKGKDPIDFYLSGAAGLCALLLLLFPTSNLANCCDIGKPYAVTHLKANHFRETFHLVCAGIFLLCLAAMSLFIFTRKKGAITPMKWWRNFVYRFCAAMMALALGVILDSFTTKIIPEDFYYAHHLTFWMETVAVEFFGLSWLVKGETILKD